MLSLEEQKCEHIVKNDVDWVVDSAASHHVIPTKGLFTTYKVGDFGVVKMGNSSYSKIVGIGDVCIKTNVGCTLILKDVRHVPDLRMNLFSTLAMDRVGYSNCLSNGRWKLSSKRLLVIARGRACCGMYKTHVRACKKKSNLVKVFEKTLQLRVDSNGVTAKRVKFSLLDSDLNEEVIFDEKYHDVRMNDEVKDHESLEQGEQYPPLEIVEPLERRCTEEHQAVSFENICASDEGEPKNWIKDIQGEINYLKMKGINFDDIFSVLVKIMKKIELGAGLTGINSNQRIELNLLPMWVGRGDCWVPTPTCPANSFA